MFVNIINRSILKMIRRVFAVVTDKDFFEFRKHAYAENLRMGDAFSALVHMYAHGYIESVKKYKQPRVIDDGRGDKKTNNAPYIKDHGKNKPDNLPTRN
jgi:hypothetical protein